jgi:2-keto-4-pentenoate hydratase/2-oxohepta-3-ene-1,7-dioic acid hydratase in catechol pathway
VAPTFIPIAGSSDVFPVRRIYCIGRNYAAHAREMGSDPNREPPFFFQKPPTRSRSWPGAPCDHPYPTLTKNYHYEVELVAALAKGGRDIPSSARSTRVRVPVGLDMTRRDLQRAMGDEKKPWEIGKSFDRRRRSVHAPVAASRHFTQGRDLAQGQRPDKQNANLNQMIWNVAEQISKLSAAFETDAGRHHLLRNARKRRTGGARRRDGTRTSTACPTSGSRSSDRPRPRARTASVPWRTGGARRRNL